MIARSRIAEQVLACGDCPKIASTAHDLARPGSARYKLTLLDEQEKDRNETREKDQRLTGVDQTNPAEARLDLCQTRCALEEQPSTKALRLFDRFRLRLAQHFPPDSRGSPNGRFATAQDVTRKADCRVTTSTFSSFESS